VSSLKTKLSLPVPVNVVAKLADAARWASKISVLPLKMLICRPVSVTEFPLGSFALKTMAI
jgi:hypothetical protein